jgi:pimeloyl-ACP methyl ester carboxylesterase
MKGESMKFDQNERRISFFRISITFFSLFLVLFLNHCSEHQTQPTQVSKEPEILILPTSIESGLLKTGAEYYISAPESLSGADLIIYAHGYYSPYETDQWEPSDDEINGKLFSEIANDLHFAYATTSYSLPGLNVPMAVSDLVALVEYFVETKWQPEHIYLIGASEGGLITTLSLEQHPSIYSGGIATCGPVGNFRNQINYLGDFHVVFNYFFPGIVPGDPEGIPAGTYAQWENIKTAVENAITANPGKTRQLLAVTRAPIDPADPVSSTVKTVTDILWYNVFATEDAKEKLGGKPFSNRFKWYSGSNNDFRLNFRIKRYRAEQIAIDNINQYYQTSGDLSVPIVMLHTTGDPIVPYWHEPLYRLKVFANGSGLMHTNIPVVRYGHCEFEMQDILVGIAVLVFKVALQDLLVPESLLPEASNQAEFMQKAQEFGAKPKIIMKQDRK